MVESKSGEELLEQSIRDMGPELGPLYHALRNEVTWVHAKWKQYRQLYAVSPERIDLLNQAAGHFFGVIQDSLLEDVVLHLARLTDSPQSRGKSNLTLRALPELIIEEPLASDIKTLVSAALAACGFVQAWRNRRLAHRDLTLALASSTDPLPGISRSDVEAALASTGAVLNRLAGHYWDTEVAYHHFIAVGRDADRLVYYLQLGVRAEVQRQKRLERGEPLPEDIESKNWV
jgi:hypothetical protein